MFLKRSVVFFVFDDNIKINDSTADGAFKRIILVKQFRIERNYFVACRAFDFIKIVFFKITAVTAFAVAVTVKCDLEILLEQGVQQQGQCGDAYHSTDDGKYGLERAALLVFHIHLPPNHPRTGVIYFPDASVTGQKQVYRISIPQKCKLKIAKS